MNLTAPTLEEWRRLYSAALAFKQEAPWEWMEEDELFGVRDPETDEIGYVSIMGILGEHLALGLYLGSEGLDGFWRMHLGGLEGDPFLLLEVSQLQASFEDRETLDDQDREVIKSLGLKFRGRQAWPMFRSYVPGRAPWFLTPQQARFLTVALEQAMDVIHRLEKDPDLLEPEEEGQYLVRVLTERGWEDQWLVPPPTPMPAPPPVDTRRLATLREKLPRQAFTLEAELFAFPSYIRDGDDPRPYVPYALMVVEAQSGFLLGTELMLAQPSLDAVWEQTIAKFLDMVGRAGSLPQRIAVRDERLYNLLMPVAAGLGIQIKQSRRLPALEQARVALQRWLG